MKAKKTAKRKSVKKIAHKQSHRVEDVPSEELTVAHILKVHATFEETFAAYGGYKSYEVQAIGALLDHIATLELRLSKCRDIMECNDPQNARDIFGEPKA